MSGLRAQEAALALDRRLAFELGGKCCGKE